MTKKQEDVVEGSAYKREEMAERVKRRKKRTRATWAVCPGEGRGEGV